ncbi:MAG: TonB-dependent receptor plug domain-containing protein [Taibaiella sp.]|jgi:TonB-dependent SusC/RagA subfamily outer membrane receptor
MEARDNIAHQIKEAVRKSETKTFSAMEKVWDRIEEKLDEEEQKEKRVIPFGKVAIAAAVLLLLSLGAVFVFQADNKPTYVHQDNRNTKSLTPSNNASGEIAKEISADKITPAAKNIYSIPRQRSKVQQRATQPEAIANHIDVNAINLKNQSLENQELYVAPKTIKGSVTDEHGEGIAGAVVLVKGTNKSTLTDLNGNYEIEVRNGQEELEIKGIGFVSKTIDINKSEHILATRLEPGDNEVPNIAIYGNKTEGKSFNGSVSSATSKDISSWPVTDISQALKGEVPGVKIAHVKARSGASDIMIGGVSTPGMAGSPLIVIDGTLYNGSLVSLKSDEVESLTVLKDGNATSIYGSRGVNGVIVIKTKNGKGYSMPKENILQKMKNMFNKKDKKESDRNEE